MYRAADTIDTLIPHYLLTCKTEGKSRRTIDWYQQKLEYFVSFLKERQFALETSTLGAQELRQFIHHLQSEVKSGENNPHRPTEDHGLSPQTVAGYVRALRAFFSWLVREEMIDEHPMKNVRTPKVPIVAMPFFTDEDVVKILNVVRNEGQSEALRKRNYTMLLLFLDTGIRVSELTGLEMQNLLLENGYFKVLGKGSKERIVPLGLNARRALGSYTRKHRPVPALPGLDRVFLTKAGYPLKPRYIHQIVSQACKKAGINGKRLGPHTCRHTFARSFLMNGGNLITLQRILGHSSLEVVKLYVNLDTQDLLAQQWKYSPVDNLKAKHSV